MVTTFKNTSYRWLGERGLPVGVKRRESVCVCVCEEQEEERGDEGPAEGKAARRGGWVKQGGSARNVNGEGGVGASVCVCVCEGKSVCTHRGVVLGEALIEKP